MHFGNMSNTKTLEVKIRPFQSSQERADQKGVSRVHLSKEALFDLKLEAGQPCLIWKAAETPDQKREAIAWPTTEKSLGKKAAQISRTFQEVCGFKLSDDLKISAAGPLQMAESIVLRDITPEDSGPELKEEDKGAWDWPLRESLFRADIIFVGIIFRDVACRGSRRTFAVEVVNDNPLGQVRYQETSLVNISSKSDIGNEPLVNGTRSKLEVVNIAGIDQSLKKLNRFLANFDRKLKFPFVQRSCAVLLHGGHGTGKTFLIQKLVATGWGKVFRIDRATKVPAIRSTFKDAKLCQPAIIILDDLETMVSREDSVAEDVTAVLNTELDNLIDGHSETLPRVFVIAATLEISKIPTSLRKRGRFKTDVSLPVPDTPARKAILKSLGLPIDPEKHDEILSRVGDRTHAYTADDLVTLMDTAGELATEKADAQKEEEVPEKAEYLTEDDIEEALLLVRPTAMHDVTLRPPSVRWDEIGGQESVKKALRRAVETPLLYPERMKRLGASAKKGLLLYGPPGCSKTLSAQAMATESGFNFFAVKGAELLNMYVGESERAVRDIFARARAASPSVIFFDEIESIGSKREGRNSGVNVLTTLLNEMDGIETLKGVTVLAATNQPQNLDLALIRPGRFDQLLYVPPPDLAGRKAILRVKQSHMDMADDVDLTGLACLTEGHSGAELVGICQVACDTVLERCEVEGQELQLTMQDFLDAIKGAKMQISPEMIEGYEEWAAGANGAVM
ncbi:putative ATPase family gene 2 protein [Amylocarpus encephaloides]|uniref:ATPase family gene 2 protein n=1 Tax=Amylocarpus encephaloides TaxID=45428 RepID=A0A9P7YHG3_9HELO|nr:putative ATPase family gene 2 protein [Amylocarpus encephaloides]